MAISPVVASSFEKSFYIKLSRQADNGRVEQVCHDCKIERTIFSRCIGFTGPFYNGQTILCVVLNQPKVRILIFIMFD